MLTSEQVQSLFAFCEKHFVKYYDVQVELVDHLANAVELEMQNEPKLSFEKAVEKVHRSFGVRGFAPLVAEKQAAAEKHNKKLFWQLFKDHFGWPKILFFFVLLIILYTLFSFDPSFMYWGSLGIIFIFWPVLSTGMLRLQRHVYKTGKKFVVINLSWIGSLLFLPVYFINISNAYKTFLGDYTFSYLQHSLIVYGVSTFLSLYIIAIVAYWQTLTSVQKDLHKNYPEVFSVAE
ncbi:MAG: hypothetical protein ABI237_18970 [Ginsengibacter sp.]